MVVGASAHPMRRLHTGTVTIVRRVMGVRTVKEEENTMAQGLEVNLELWESLEQ